MIAIYEVQRRNASDVELFGTKVAAMDGMWLVGDERVCLLWSQVEVGPSINPSTHPTVKSVKGLDLSAGCVSERASNTSNSLIFWPLLRHRHS